MSDGIKIAYRTEFPRADRVLFIRAETGEAVTVSVTKSSTGQIISLKRFEDYNEAMNYYRGQFNNLKSAEEYETMLCALNCMELCKETNMISILYQTEFSVRKRLLCIYANAGGTACVRVRRTDTYEVVKEVSGVGAEEAMELYEKLLNLYAKCENCKMPCCTR